MTEAITPASAAPPPTASSPRLGAIDAARGVALVGMMMINILTVRADGWFNKLWTIPLGRASVLFVLLAGLGMTLFLRSRQGQRSRAVLLGWRAAIFFLGGLSLQILTPAVSVILPTYGVLFLGALLWHRLSTKVLGGVALTMLVLGPVIVQGHQNTGEHKSRMPSLLDSPGDVLHSLFLSGAYPILVWVVPFLVGMLLARQDLRSRELHLRLIRWGATAAVLAFVAGQITTAALGTELESGWPRLLTGTAHSQMPLWLISSVGSAVFVLGVLLWAWPRLHRAARPLADLGRLAFTFYVAHFLVIAALGGRIDVRVVGVPITVGLVLVFGIFATVWVRRLGIGPLERALRASWLDKIVKGAA